MQVIEETMKSAHLFVAGFCFKLFLEFKKRHLQDLKPAKYLVYSVFVLFFI